MPRGAHAGRRTVRVKTRFREPAQPGESTWWTSRPGRPAPVTLKGCWGRSPGFRVITLCPPSRWMWNQSPVARWGKDSPITVAGAAPDFECDAAALGTGFPINPVW